MYLTFMGMRNILVYREFVISTVWYSMLCKRLAQLKVPELYFLSYAPAIPLEA